MCLCNYDKHSKSMVEDSKHVGFPLPSEMFHPHTYCWDMPADEIACKLLDIPRKCAVCGKVIEENDL